jgi:hypothetical protein
MATDFRQIIRTCDSCGQSVPGEDFPAYVKLQDLTRVELCEQCFRNISHELITRTAEQVRAKGGRRPMTP